MKEIISLDRQSGNVSFRPHARLIRLLGDELISDEIVAVVELVKNSYDADASHVQILLDHVTDPTGGRICIRDDGEGMDLFTLLHVWMEPATTHKRRRHRKKLRTARGRMLLGEKGVGRFAADKLGAELELVTRDRSTQQEVVLHVFWNQFDDEDSYLEDISNSWFVREPVEFPGEQHGTLLTIRSLRVAWTEEMVSKLYNGLSRLVSPFVGENDFSIEIHCPQYPAIQGKVVNRLLETAPYHLSGHIDDRGYFHAAVAGELPVDLCALNQQHFLASDGTRRTPLCGPFRLALHVWDLDVLPGGRGINVDRSLRDALKTFCGVSVYRDGFRIWPYGEKDDDWLELNQRRVNNPTLRISNNQIIGFIEITHDGNPDLRDRTSREGLIDTPAFFDLKALVLAALSLLEASRFDQRHQGALSRSPEEEKKDDLLSYLSGISKQASDPAQQQSLRGTVREIERLYRHRLEQERLRYDRISALAGVGMTAELLTEALARNMNNTVMLLHVLRGEAQVDAGPRVRQIVELLTEHMNQIHNQLDLVEPLYHPQNRNEPVDIRRVIYDVLTVMHHRLDEAKVQVNLECQTELIVRLGRGYLMQALMMVIVNALESMQDAAIDEPRLEIQIAVDRAFQGILIANNGPAIPVQYRKLIFEPSFSLRNSGRGLGLPIARDLLAACHCTLDLADDTLSPLPGPCFRIRFDRRRVTTS